MVKKFIFFDSKSKRGFRFWMTRMGLAISLVLVAYAVFFSVESAYLVSEKMTGRIWSVPSRVYASSRVLFPGLRYSKEDLIGELEWVGYVQSREAVPGFGEWKKDGPYLLIGIRSFSTSSQDLEARKVRIEFSGNHIERIWQRDGDQWKIVHTLSLEPELIGEIFRDEREQRTLIRLDEAPKTLKEAIILMEDRGFYDHWGVSLRGIGRALLANFQGRGIRQGGSTLTQQLMKNFFLTHERTLQRKAREAIMAIVAEILFTKDQIFEAYLNEIYLGQQGPVGIHGFGEAARFYFSKELKQLSLGEQAMLVGLISSPGRYSPYRSLESATERRNLVLSVLYKGEKIQEKDFEIAKREALHPRGKIRILRKAPHFIAYLQKELEKRYEKDFLESSGFQILTTLDMEFQRAAEASVEEVLPKLDERSKKRVTGERKLEVALISVDPHSGAVKAYVGGRDFSNSQFDRVHRAQRQPGSSIKPIVAAIAMSNETRLGEPVAHPATVLSDQPAEFSYSGRDWSPKNYGDVYTGQITLRGALEKSQNVAFVNLASQIGLKELQKGFYHFGFQDVPEFPSIALGAFGVTPFELARVYTAFPNGGLQTECYAISGVLSEKKERKEQTSMAVRKVTSAQIAYVVTQLMKGVVERGTARKIQGMLKGQDFAGKTGTSDDYRDSWFVGYSANLLTVVWLGYDDDTPMGLTGASGALEVWANFYQRILERLPREAFAEPKGVEWRKIDPEKGCLKRGLFGFEEVFIQGTEVPPCR